MLKAVQNTDEKTCDSPMSKNRKVQKHFLSSDSGL